MVCIFRGASTEQIAAGSHVSVCLYISRVLFGLQTWDEGKTRLESLGSIWVERSGPAEFVLKFHWRCRAKISMVRLGEDGSLPYDCRNCTALSVERDGEVPP